MTRNGASSIGVVVSAIAVVIAACGSSSGSGGWTAATVPEAQGATVAAVASDGKAFVAVGQVPKSGEAAHGAAWTSPDGRTWTAAADQAGFAQEQWVSVADGSGGYLALAQSCGNGNCVQNAIWRSSDGTTWTAAAAIGPFGPITPVPGTVAPGGPGWLVGGWEEGAADSGVQPAIWTSSDGSTWSEAQVADVADGPLTGGAVGGIATFGSRTVAVGWVKPASGRRAETWTSTDGVSWTPAPDSPAFADGLMSAVAAGANEIVAVGTDGQGAAVWDSSDGTVWDKVAPGPGFAGARMTAITASDGDFVAVGSDDKGAAAWTSTDGKTWTQDPADSFAGGKALGVTVGSDRDGRRRHRPERRRDLDVRSVGQTRALIGSRADRRREPTGADGRRSIGGRDGADWPTTGRDWRQMSAERRRLILRVDESPSGGPEMFRRQPIVALVVLALVAACAAPAASPSAAAVGRRQRKPPAADVLADATAHGGSHPIANVVADPHSGDAEPDGRATDAAPRPPRRSFARTSSCAIRSAVARSSMSRRSCRSFGRCPRARRRLRPRCGRCSRDHRPRSGRRSRRS